ncbi:MAG: IclR family transcriptional regulator [Planctomycetaceae bacterium]|nr:IclR family transcriptional regulator [Planctomycetaceae bacterium]
MSSKDDFAEGDKNLESETQDAPLRSEAASLQRGLAVLEMLAVRPDGATLRDITEKLQLPGASMLRIARTLVELGYLSRDERTKRFFLTNSFLLLGQPRATSRGLSECAISAMRRIRQVTGETTQLCCLIGDEMVILEQLLSVHPFKYSADLGARCPCYSSAPGKAHVAFLSAEEQETLVNRLQFKRFTAQTITSKRAFRIELERIRNQGYAVDRAEGLEGIHCVAAPVLDRHGSAVGSITIAGPSARIPEDEFESIGHVVREGARVASDEFNRQ